MNTEFTVTQKRALAVVTIISLLFAGYFLRSYFVLIVVAAVTLVAPDAARAQTATPAPPPYPRATTA